MNHIFVSRLKGIMYGQFTDAGYLSYHSFVSIVEVMAGLSMKPMAICPFIINKVYRVNMLR